MKKIFNKPIISIATITIVVVSFLSLMGVISLSAGAVSPEPAISIDTITDVVDTYYDPFDFSCPIHPLFSPIPLLEAELEALLQGTLINTMFRLIGEMGK